MVSERIEGELGLRRGGVLGEGEGGYEMRKGLVIGGGKVGEDGKGGKGEEEEGEEVVEGKKRWEEECDRMNKEREGE